MYHTVRTYMLNDETIDALPLTAVQAYLVSRNNTYANHYIDDSVDTLLDAFNYLTFTFSRKLRGYVHCEVVTYWGEVFKAKGDTPLLAGCRAVYKALKLIGGRLDLDYYQRYL